MERGVRPSILSVWLSGWNKPDFFFVWVMDHGCGGGWDENSFIFISLDLINTN